MVLFVGLFLILIFLILIFLILVFLILFFLLVLLIFVVLLLLILFLLFGFFQEGGEFLAELRPVGGFRVEFRAGIDGGESVADGALGDGLLFGLEAAAPRDGFAAEFGPVAGGAGFGGGDATDDFGESFGGGGVAAGEAGADAAGLAGVMPKAQCPMTNEQRARDATAVVSGRGTVGTGGGVRG